MMIGGETEVGEAARSDLRDAGARASGDIPRTPGREKARRHGRARLSALRPERRGALRQDGPQRHRVRPHGGLRRRAGHPARQPTSASSSTRSTPRRLRCAIPSIISTISNSADIAEVWRRGSVIASWLLDLTALALWQGSRRWPNSRAASPTPAKGAGRSRRRSTRPCRRRCSRRRCTSASARAARPTSRTSCSRRCASSSAATWRRPAGSNAA